MQDMERLRSDIAGLTFEIIRLVGRRNKLASEIGRLKDRYSLPLDNPDVEVALMESVIRECDMNNVDRRAGLKILATLLQESKRVQGRNSVDARITPMAIASKAIELQRKGRKLIRLDVGEPDFPPPSGVVKATIEALSSFKTHYTQSRGIQELLSALSGYIAKKYGYSFEENQMLVTPGGRFAVFAAISTVVNEGENALIIEPNWPMYKEALDYIGATSTIINTKMEDEWEPSLDQIAAGIRKNTRAIILSYPNNPTGSIISQKKFDEIVKIANDNKVTVISDEIYNEYSYVESPSILRSKAERFILTSSFSKTWAMTGFRIGYAISSSDYISSMLKITSLMITSVPEFVQYGAIKALQSDKEVKENVRTMKERIEAACEELERVSELEYSRPKGGMYVFPQAKSNDFDSAEFTSRLLEQKGVSITPGVAFGNYPKAFRISLGQPEDVIREGIRRIGELLS